MVPPTWTGRVKGFSLAGLLGLALASAGLGFAGQPETTDRFRLEGTVRLPGDVPLDPTKTEILLEGATFPYSRRTRIWPSGKFVFSGVPAGMYRLIVSVAAWGSREYSVDIGPSTANERGVVERRFTFEPDPGTSAGGTVDYRQLNVDRRAQRALAKAEELLGKQEVEKAIAKLHEALEIAPHYAAAWNRLGTIHFLNRRFEEAKQCFLAALEHEPNQYAATVNLGAAYLELGDFDAALRWNARAVEMRPTDPLAHSQLGQTYFVQGDFTRAERELRKAKELDPDHFSHPQLVLAEIFRRQHRYAELAGELEDFLTRHPDSPAAPALREYLAAVRALLAAESPAEGP
ncbi:MAG: hypothetical protein Kow00109_00180 [Acidobacteriota bacterium]